MVQSAVQSTVQSTVQLTAQSTVQSNRAYVYGLGTLAALAIGVCVFFVYKIYHAANKKQVNEKQGQLSKRRHLL